MKLIIIILMALPTMLFAQVKKSKPLNNTTKPTAKKPVSAAKNVAGLQNTTTGGYTITVKINGVADGAVLKLLNGNTGAEEGSTMMKLSKGSFSGKVDNPDFKLICINGVAPYITLFADNSVINITSNVNEFEKATITGSTSHNDYANFATATTKYQDLFNGKGNYPIAFLEEASVAIENFVKANPQSYVSPLAIFRHNQVTGDYKKQEAMYNTLAANIKTSTIGKYIEQQISQNIAAGYGKPLANFSQADTTGIDISLASFKGKYVLVDFWASWCRPCRMENPNVVRTFEKYKNKNFTVLGVSLDQDKQKWVEAIAADNLKWTNVSDLKGWGNAVAAQFGIQSIPQNLLIDTEGNLIGKNLRGSALEYRIMQILK